jgi:hypothetical protein
VTVCRGRDHQVEAACRGLSTCPVGRGSTFTVTGGDCSIDRERLAAAEDRAQPSESMRSTLIIWSNQDTAIRKRCRDWQGRSSSTSLMQS